MLVSSASQAEYMTRIRDVDRERCLVVPIDVGKRSAMALVADHCHEVVVGPFTFDLNESGVEYLLAKADAYAEYVGAGSVRFGVEAAGHYHRGLVTRLDTGGHDVVEINPAIVKDARGRIGARRVKTDIQDCLAMAEVLIDGLGHTPTQRSVTMATQAAWAGQRRRKVEARGTLARQIHTQVDLAFPHLTGCYSHGLDMPSLRVILTHICDPARIVRLGPKRLRDYVVNRGVRMWAPKAVQVVDGVWPRRVAGEVLGSGIGLSCHIFHDVGRRTHQVGWDEPEQPERSDLQPSSESTAGPVSPRQDLGVVLGREREARSDFVVVD